MRNGKHEAMGISEPMSRRSKDLNLTSLASTMRDLIREVQGDRAIATGLRDDLKMLLKPSTPSKRSWRTRLYEKQRRREKE